LFGDVVFLGLVVIVLGVLLMDKVFLVESKAFTFSVLGGALTLRVEEKRKNFSGCGLVECSERRMACVDVGSVVGPPDRASLCEVI
jgi:hypothetical protein